MPTRRRLTDLTRRSAKPLRLLGVMCLLLLLVCLMVPVAANPRTWDWLFREPVSATQPAGPSLPPIRLRGFDAVQDRTPGLSVEEQAVARELLTAIAEAPDGTGRTDLTYTNLIARPEQCRGEALQLRGRIRRLQRCDEELEPAENGVWHEAWLFTDSSGVRPYRILLAELPAGWAPGLRVEISAEATVYFFKLASYESPAGPAVAPLQVASKVRTAD